MDAARLICARLLREGAVRRSEVPELDLPDVRRAVEGRLASVGLELATSAYSEHVGIRLAGDLTADEAFNAASNLGLRADHCALLVILWARLVLQKRTVVDRKEVPGEQAQLLQGENAAAAQEFEPQVRIEALAREFGGILGSKSHIKSLVTALRRRRFVAGRGEIVEAGPLLELGIDGERMVAFIRRGVLKQLLGKPQQEPVDAPSNGKAEALIAALRRVGGDAAIGQLAEETGEERDRLRPILQELIDEGRVSRTGQRWHTRYCLNEEGDECSASTS